MKPGAERGFSLLELAVVVSLISILVVVAFDRIWSLRAEAERVAVAQVVGAIRSALGIEVARRVLREGVETLAELDGANPMPLLAQVPPGYRGELTDRELGSVGPGEWYFDKTRGRLGYRVRFAEAFESELSGDRAEYRVMLRYEDRNGDRRFDRDHDSIQGLDLVAAGRFRWIVEAQNPSINLF
ncbi:MAG: hypothetical protein Kow006_13670 [Gammaproteobacteria bacterium]